MSKQTQISSALSIPAEPVRKSFTSFLDIHVAVSGPCHAHLCKSQSLLMEEFGHVILSDEADGTVTKCVTLQGLKPLLYAHGMMNLAACINFSKCLYLCSMCNVLEILI